MARRRVNEKALSHSRLTLLDSMIGSVATDNYLASALAVVSGEEVKQITQHDQDVRESLIFELIFRVDRENFKAFLDDGLEVFMKGRALPIVCCSHCAHIWRSSLPSYTFEARLTLIGCSRCHLRTKATNALLKNMTEIIRQDTIQKYI